MALVGVQKDVLQWALTNPTKSAFITGGAGTGKSYLLRAVLEEVTRQGVKGVYVTASTGIAAVNVDGVTLYNLLGVRPGFENMKPHEVVKFAKGFLPNPDKDGAQPEPWQRAKVYILNAIHTLVIDEISMVHALFFRNADIFLRIIRGEKLIKGLKGSRVPFGGLRLLMMGDFLQLPPVAAKDADEDDELFVFETVNWKSLEPDIFVLQHSFRQENDIRFFKMLNEIRWGMISDETRLLLQGCVRSLPDDYTGPRMTLMPVNADVDRINKMHIDGIEKPVQCFKAKDSGNGHLLRDLRALPSIELKEGAQVMLLKNITIKKQQPDIMDIGDESGGNNAALVKPDIIPNRAMGMVIGFLGGTETAPEKVMVGFPDIGNVPSHDRPLGLEKFDIVETMDKPPVATRWQVPLIPSYAMSIHKSQGQTIVN